jgi:cyclopropane-fatty-acyl-phospholipid synthase
LFTTVAAKVARTYFSLRHNVAGNIQFHYDRSNQFYQTFLDSSMVYSCAYFRKPTDSLEAAQEAKLDHICRKLRVERGDRFLDIGCGWGGLMFHAAERYGATCTGCTLSHAQLAFVQEKLESRGYGDQIRVLETDFQKVRGRFDKIASVGMFEHVGRRRLRSYFTHIAGSLAENGLFLNHAIARPETVKDGAETLFLQRNVFPGGDLLHVSEVIRSAEEAGFEVLDLENLRPHYALTCRAWVNRLQAAAEECLRTVTRDVYRTWLLYLAGCAVSFEEGRTDIYQALFAKRTTDQRRALTREYMYCR